MNFQKILYLIGGILILVVVFVGLASISGLVSSKENQGVPSSATSAASQNSGTETEPIKTGSGSVAPTPKSVEADRWGMKLVNETVTDQDLDAMKSIGITLIEGEWGMADADAKKTRALLDRLAARGMKLIMNFTEESAWGYTLGDDPAEQKPAWQKTAVEAYVRAIMVHPAVFGYDISNEAGENLPNGDRFRISVAQMKEAAKTVRAVDPTKPVLMRMHYWDRFDGDFTDQNPFAPGIADIVMLNLYSNWSEDGVKADIPDMVSVSAESLVDKVHGIDPEAEVWIALAAYREAPSFLRPSAAELARDIRAALAVKGVKNISFFGWGPERYPDQGPGWYLPRDGADLMKTIQSFAKPGS